MNTYILVAFNIQYSIIIDMTIEPAHTKTHLYKMGKHACKVKVIT